MHLRKRFPRCRLTSFVDNGASAFTWGWSWQQGLPCLGLGAFVNLKQFGILVLLQQNTPAFTLGWSWQQGLLGLGLRQFGILVLLLQNTPAFTFGWSWQQGLLSINSSEQKHPIVFWLVRSKKSCMSIFMLVKGIGQSLVLFQFVKKWDLLPHKVERQPVSSKQATFRPD